MKKTFKKSNKNSKIEKNLFQKLGIQIKSKKDPLPSLVVSTL